MATTVGPVSTWDEVEEKVRGDYTPLPAGLYENCYLYNWEKANNKAGTKTYYKPEFVIVTEDGEEHHVWGYWGLEPKSRGFLKSDLAALGVSLNGIAVDDTEAIEEAFDSAKNQPCRIQLKIRPYTATDDDGNEVLRDSNDIRKILPAR